MSTVWGALIGALIRWILMLIAGPLVAKGIIGDDLLERLMSEGTAQIVAGVISVGVLLWSFRAKIVAWVKLRFALNAEPTASISAVESRVSAVPETTKVSMALKGE